MKRAKGHSMELVQDRYYVLGVDGREWRVFDMRRNRYVGPFCGTRAGAQIYADKYNGKDHRLCVCVYPLPIENGFCGICRRSMY